MKTRILSLITLTLMVGTLGLRAANHPAVSRALNVSGSLVEISPASSTSTPLASDDSFGDLGSTTAQFDPGEAVPGVTDIYFTARRDIVAGAWEEARSELETAVKKYPTSRHLHEQLAAVLWYIYADRGNSPAVLEQAKEEAVQATEFGLRRAIINPSAVGLLSQILGKAGDTTTLDRLFTEILKREPDAVMYLYYAQGLAAMNDSRAEATYEKALRRDRAGDVLPAYCEFLLDQGRNRDVINLTINSSGDYYVHFLRGVAFERLGDAASAKKEYAQYFGFNKNFPAPAKYKLPGSTLQENVRFKGNSGSLISRATGLTDSQSIAGLSYLISGEAPSESRGGRRAEGWVVRSRVLRGALGTGSYCPGAYNSGSTLADQYSSVMCAGSGSQFNGMCLAWCSNPNTSACTALTGTSTTAYNVYYGYEPDPVSNHCPGGGASSSDPCADTASCSGGYTNTYRLDGPVFNYGTSSSCPSSSTICTSAITSVGKVCGNGLSDNCFYYNHAYGTGSFKTYTGTESATGDYLVSATINSAGGTFKGHLEGPETTANPDFDLYLEHYNSSSGAWEQTAYSVRNGVVEDINVTVGAGSYRWGVYSYRGSGSFSLYTKEP